MSKSQTISRYDRAGTGIRGLDRILRGGFPRERTYLVYGAAGTGKTTLGFQFLLEGAQAGEKVLYITLLQHRSEIQDIAESHGWSLDNVNILELPSEVRDGEATKQTVFSPADVELNEAVDAIIDGIKEHKPQRLVLDSVSELSVLVNSRYQLRRSARLGLPIADNIDRGYIDLQQVDVGQMSSGEFMQAIVGSVEDKGARVVVIDSLTGYLNAMLHESMVVAQLHELLSYLNSRGVISIMTLATHGIYGNDETEIDASYLADTVLLARHFEAGGALRRCISVVKKRYGGHEKTIREFDLSPGSILVGPPLRNFSGVLSGIPRFEGEGHRLLDQEA